MQCVLGYRPSFVSRYLISAIWNLTKPLSYCLASFQHSYSVLLLFVLMWAYIGSSQTGKRPKRSIGRGMATCNSPWCSRGTKNPSGYCYRCQRNLSPRDGNVPGWSAKRPRKLQKVELTPRTCLKCGEAFMSDQPKSQRRICDGCTEANREAGDVPESGLVSLNHIKHVIGRVRL